MDKVKAAYAYAIETIVTYPYFVFWGVVGLVVILLIV